MWICFERGNPAFFFAMKRRSESLICSRLRQLGNDVCRRVSVAPDAISEVRISDDYTPSHSRSAAPAGIREQRSRRGASVGESSVSR